MSSATNTSAHHTSTVGAPSRRNTELALLVFAVVIPVLAYVNVGLAINNQVPSGLLSYGWARACWPGSLISSYGSPHRTRTRCCCRWPRC